MLVLGNADDEDVVLEPEAALPESGPEPAATLQEYGAGIDFISAADEMFAIYKQRPLSVCLLLIGGVS